MKKFKKITAILFIFFLIPISNVIAATGGTTYPPPDGGGSTGGTTSDTTPPAEVTGLVQGTSADGNLGVSWDAVTDPDVDSIYLYQNGVDVTSGLGFSASFVTEYYSSSFQPGDTIKVTTKDATGNESSGQSIVLTDSPNQTENTSISIGLELLSGNLSIGSVSITDFGDITLNGGTQTITSTINPFDVTDATGTGSGWHAMVRATPFTEVGGLGLTLPEQSLSLNAPVVTPVNTPSIAPIVQTGAPWYIDKASATQILSAAVDTGIGVYNIDFGLENLTLTIPNDVKLVDTINYPNTPTPYESTITFSIVSGP